MHKLLGYVYAQCLRAGRVCVADYILIDKHSGPMRAPCLCKHLQWHALSMVSCRDGKGAACYFMPESYLSRYFRSAGIRDLPDTVCIKYESISAAVCLFALVYHVLLCYVPVLLETLTIKFVPGMSLVQLKAVHSSSRKASLLHCFIAVSSICITGTCAESETVRAAITSAGCT